MTYNFTFKDVPSSINRSNLLGLGKIGPNNAWPVPQDCMSITVQYVVIDEDLPNTSFILYQRTSIGNYTVLNQQITSRQPVVTPVNLSMGDMVTMGLSTGGAPTISGTIKFA